MARVDGRVRAVTHDGSFHADDVFAAALLRLLHGDGVTVTRTRDPGLIAVADVAFDVGGVHDPERNRFDHHMRGAPRRACGTPYSALGQMWAARGRTAVLRVWASLDEAEVEAVWADVDAGLVLAIDEVDNGCRTGGPDGVAALVGALNGPGDGDAGFEAATAFATLALRGTIARAAEAVAARRPVAAAARHRANPAILALPVHASWGRAVFELGLDEVLLVVAPRRDGSWGVTCVPPEPGSMAQRHPLPAAWAGLTGGDLAAATGVPDAAFCHANRFMAVCGTPEGAMALAERALAP